VQAAKAATTTIPIVFRTGGDPVELGLVASFNEPGGNITGVNALSLETGTKRLGLLRELLPQSSRVAVLINPNDPNAEHYTKDLQTAASTVGRIPPSRRLYWPHTEGREASNPAGPAREQVRVRY
jgi:putative ABC transport system substrate-binding protein